MEEIHVEYFEEFGILCHDMEGVRYAVHTMQWAVLGALKTKPFFNWFRRFEMFSCLKFILSSYRASLTDDIIEDIISTRANREN